jgi:hypothetical protein
MVCLQAKVKHDIITITGFHTTCKRADKIFKSCSLEEVQTYEAERQSRGPVDG